MSSGINRPFKYGHNDRREFIVQDSEVAMRLINDENGNPIFVGRAKIGITDDEQKWQIKKITYDSTLSPITIKWPLNADSVGSSNYEFVWSNNTTPLTITNISQAATAVVTVSDLGNLSNGDKIVIQDVEGMTEVNFDGTNIYTVANILTGPKTFELTGINSTAYGAYTSGGTVNYSEVIGYTYV